MEKYSHAAGYFPLSTTSTQTLILLHRLSLDGHRLTAHKEKSLNDHLVQSDGHPDKQARLRENYHPALFKSFAICKLPDSVQEYQRTSTQRKVRLILGPTRLVVLVKQCCQYC